MADALAPQVGYILGITPSASSIPTETAIDQWLKDGTQYIVSVTPTALIDAPDNITLSLQQHPIWTGYGEGSFPMGCDRLISVSYEDGSGNRTPCKIVSGDFAHMIFDMGVKISDLVCTMLEKDKIIVNNYEASSKLVIYYIKDINDSSILADWQKPFAVDYAVIMAKKESQEVGEFQNYLNEWMTKYMQVMKERLNDYTNTR